MRPATVVALTFSRDGSPPINVQLMLAMTIEEFRALMNTELNEQITLKTVQEGVLQNGKTIFGLHKEEFHFTRGDVIWWSAAVSCDPPPDIAIPRPQLVTPRM